MNNQPKPATPAKKTAMYFILGLPVMAVIVVIGIGVYAQRDNITPRWKKKDSPASMEKGITPANSSTNTPAENP